MKVDCPICGVAGFLEVRGNSYRIKHWQGFENGKRRYIIHSLEKEHILKMGIMMEPKSHSLDQASRQPLML
jgi:hypothetical protein